MRCIPLIIVLSVLFYVGGSTNAHPPVVGVVERVSVGFGIPAGLLLTLCERESGPREDSQQVLRPEADHDGGAGAGACGMKLETARRILNVRVVTKEQLHNLAFTAVLAARYLSDEQWCGRWLRWETRVLCYRVGPNHRVLAKMDRELWKNMPTWWGTYKIFKRWRELHGRAQG